MCSANHLPDSALSLLCSSLLPSLDDIPAPCNLWPHSTVEQIVAVYHSASKQKAWDHFTKAQRKNISVWCKQAEVGNFYSLYPLSLNNLLIGKLAGS